MDLHRLAPLALAAAAGCAGPRLAPPPPDGAARLAEADAAVLQGDGPRAVAVLRSVGEGALPVPEAAQRRCMLERLSGPAADRPDPGAPLAARVLAAYRAYWRAALGEPAARAGAEARLEERLRQELGGDEAPAADAEALERLLAERLRRDGVHALAGRTPPLLELMIWREEEERGFEVALPEGPQRVRVLLLDGFESPGWADFATCGRRGTGGWADAEVLRVVRARWGSLEDEPFQVSFLAHEAQHLADLRRPGSLAPWELEYRAKLAELSLASRTRTTLLEKFTRDQADDPALPHPYADRQVLAELRARLGVAAEAGLPAVPEERLRAAAVAALKDDARRRWPGP